MKIADLQKRHDEATVAIGALRASMPNQKECTETIFMECNGERAKDNSNYEIKLATVVFVPDNKIQIRSERLPYIKIGNDLDGKYKSVCIPVEAIKPLIKILEGLI